MRDRLEFRGFRSKAQRTTVEGGLKLVMNRNGDDTNTVAKANNSKEKEEPFGKLVVAHFVAHFVALVEDHLVLLHVSCSAVGDHRCW